MRKPPTSGDTAAHCRGRHRSEPKAPKPGLGSSAAERLVERCRLRRRLLRDCERLAPDRSPAQRSEIHPEALSAAILLAAPGRCQCLDEPDSPAAGSVVIE